ncbi:MAG: hypothetical protein RLZZ50_1553, partial [Verrucomicrobiota bacterium]
MRRPALLLADLPHTAASPQARRRRGRAGWAGARLGGRVLFLAVILAARPASAGSPAAFAPGDRWVVLGDSITQTGAYHRELELFHLTRRPAVSVEAVNRGLAGDTVTGALRRL